jgi:hypothetical protein
LGNSGHDREAETRAGRVARSIGTAESFEGVSEERSRESVALVGNVKCDQAIVFDCLDSYRSGAVTKRVLDQV